MMRIVIKARPREQAEQIVLSPIRLHLRARPQRVLDFDIENRPLSYLGSDFTTGEVTAVAWAWCDQPEGVTVHLLRTWGGLPQILRAFVDVYTKADMVTGHYITGHDLPMIQGALMECGLPLLGEKLVQDTKNDLPRIKGLSKSQENLAAMFGLRHPKHSMNAAQWRAANRLTPEGLELVRERVVADVKQHMELRRHLLEQGYLSPPKMWDPGIAKLEPYTP